MADSSGQAEIRGIDIDKLAKGFGELFPNVLKQYNFKCFYKRLEK